MGFVCLFLVCLCILDGTDLFTIKIHGRGNFDGVSGAYVGGEFRYVDNCDIDEMSILELDSMLVEAFGTIGYTEQWRNQD